MIGWWILLGASCALFVLVAVAAWGQRRRESPGRARRAAERAEWAQHAAAVTARSRDAEAEAAASRGQVALAEQARTEAWQALEQAQAAHDQAERRYTRARQRPGAGPGADPAGQREVAGAALAAFRRGDLSREQLWRVWGWGTGWDPELAAQERALLQARAARREAHLAYRAAAGRERAAAAALEIAEVQARALAEEVATAAAEAGWEDVGDEPAAGPR
jgi:hypothetical protein